MWSWKETKNCLNREYLDLIWKKRWNLTKQQSDILKTLSESSLTSKSIHSLNLLSSLKYVFTKYLVVPTHLLLFTNWLKHRLNETHRGVFTGTILKSCTHKCLHIRRCKLTFPYYCNENSVGDIHKAVHERLVFIAKRASAELQSGGHGFDPGLGWKIFLCLHFSANSSRTCGA